MNMEEDSKTISTTNAQYLVRTGGVNTMPLTHFTIPTPYIHSHNECNAIKALKGTKFKPFCALLALLPKRFTTTTNAISLAALDLSLKIQWRESSDSRFTEQVVGRDEDGKAETDAETGV